MNVEEMLVKFLRFLVQERGYSENTVAAYRRDLSQFFIFYAEYANQVPVDITTSVRCRSGITWGVTSRTAIS
jgi:site-specific recombinase XerD